MSVFQLQELTNAFKQRNMIIHLFCFQINYTKIANPL
jgi:hypothetical protein